MLAEECAMHLPGQRQTSHRKQKATANPCYGTFGQEWGSVALIFIAIAALTYS